MLGTHPSIDLPQSTEYAKEMRRWEAYPTKFGPAGRPYAHREFPKRVYTAEADEKGSRRLVGATCPDERDLPNFLSRGFHPTQEAALEAWDRQHTEHGKLAAEINYEIAQGRVSARAAAEVQAARQAHGARHLPEVPETPIPVHRKRSRKPTAESPVSA